MKEQTGSCAFHLQFKYSFVLHLLQLTVEHCIDSARRTLMWRCVCSGLFVCLLFSLLFSTDRDSGTALTPCQYDWKETGKREKRNHLLTEVSVNTHITNCITPSTNPSYKVQKDHNETVITNITGPEQTKDTLSALWNGHSYQIHWGITFEMSMTAKL